jgi:hypothetical protein
MEMEEVMTGQELSGYFRLKRKVFWARRFIVVKSGILYYYKNPTSTTPRGIFHLLGRKVNRDSKDLILEILKGQGDSLKIQFTSASEFNVWLNYLSLSIMSEKAPAQVCPYEEMVKISQQENQKLIQQIPQSNFLPALKSKIDEIKGRSYLLVGTRGSSLFSCTCGKVEEKKEKNNDWRLLSLAFFAVVLIIDWAIGRILSLCFIAAFAIYVHLSHNRVKDVPTVESKIYFKNTGLFKAGVGEILTALFDTVSRSAWDPYLTDASESSVIRLTYHFNSSTTTQEMSRSLLKDGSIFYIVEKTGLEVKNLFAIESKDKKGQLQTLITHYGAMDSKNSPLIGNADLLNCLKVFVESNTVYVNTQPIIAGDKSSDEEDQTESGSILENEPKHLYANEAKRVAAEVEEFLNTKEGWESLKLSSSLVKGFRKKTDAGFFVVKSEGEIKRSPEEILICLKDLSRKQAYDLTFESGYTVETIDLSTEIVYQKYKGKLGVSARDFCLLQTRVEYPDGRVLALATSISHPKCPETKCVRAHLYFGVHLLTPVSSQITLDTYMIYVDIRGNIPKFLANTVQVDQAMLVENLRNFLN